MKVAILGGGGQTGTAIGAKLIRQGHKVWFYRFPAWINIPGVPKRPKKSRTEIEELKLAINKSTVSEEGYRAIHRWANELEFNRVDILIFTFPSYLAEILGHLIGHHISGVPFLNISDRFLGSIAFLKAANGTKRGSSSFCIALGSPPLLAYQLEQAKGETILYYQKPVVLISCFPVSEVKRSLHIINHLFDIPIVNIRVMPTLLHLAFENIQSIVHAVQDLYNLKKGYYTNPKYLYSPLTYTPEIVERINKVVEERDLIAATFGIHGLRSLKEFDNSTFITSKVAYPVGTAYYRHVHPLLSKLPAPPYYKCHGFEDVGWSMVTLESFGLLAKVLHPELTSLIDEWNILMKVDYRRVGRTVQTLDIAHIPISQITETFQS